MGIIGDFMARNSARKQKMKEYEDNDRVVNAVETKKKSHAERELIKSLQEDKEKLMKEALYWENRKRQLEDKKKAYDMMHFNPEFFRHPSILKEKNLFLRGGDF